MILAARLESGTSTATGFPGEIAEKGLEEVAETGTVAKAFAAELETGVPASWRMEFLACFPVCAELIIG